MAVTLLTASSVYGACIIQDGLELPTGIRGDKVERVLAGHYLKHSSHYFRWFLKEQHREIQANGPSVQTTLGLTAAMGRLGQWDKATNTVHAHLKKQERYSLYIQAGGIHLLNAKYGRSGAAFSQAFNMNPNGEFTRDGYPHHLLDYMSKQAARDRKKMPMVTAVERDAGYPRLGFSHFFHDRGRKSGVFPSESWQNGGREQALNGLLRLVLCGFHRLPQLYEAIGDILLEGPVGGKGNHLELAAMAYLRASYTAADSIWSRLEYRKLAQSAVPGGTKKALRALEKRFGKVIRKGSKRYKQVRLLEQKWAKKRFNLESRFEKVFLTGTR